MNSNLKNIFITILFFTLLVAQTNAEVKLPKFIADGMVLQRNIPVKIWGWANSGEKVTITFLNKKYSAVTDSKGNWLVTLPKLKPGGPFELEVEGTNKIIIKNILVGDVWVCSGQSNMQTTMARVRDLYEDVIANSENKMIRYFEVPMKYEFNGPLNDVQNGKWVSPDPQSILNFSAVAYFFAKNIYEKYKVPIGLINTAIGGAPIEAYVSADVIKNFPNYLPAIEKFKDINNIQKVFADNKKINDEWYSELMKKDLGYSGNEKKWYDTSYNANDWSKISVPCFWDEAGLKNINGSVWFRKEFDIPESMAGKSVRLNLGRIVDSDSAFVNGKFVGSVSYQYPPRIYKIPAGVLKTGKNILVVRIVNNAGRGGFIKDKPYNIILDGQSIDLKGEWQYKIGAEMKPMPVQESVQNTATGFFNGMIAPLLNYAIKGVLWYQGESNTNRAAEYKKIFPAMINDWRHKWNIGTFPFLYVQLPNFMETNDQPVESQWAELREAQLKTLSVPKTGMAVAIDLGEWNDIHPWRKKEVGDRLALLAQSIAYGNKKIVPSGPLYKSMKLERNKIILSFKNVDGGLIAKGGNELKYFAIAGADKKFVWAKAEIKNNKVVVWNDEIKNPVAVRYAWADNPDGANLYNKEELPASPFRTDE
jgi:sialate O-acetylesterase